MTATGLRQWSPDAPQGEWQRYSPALQGYRYLCLDLETGGLDPLHCGITEIGAVVCRHDGAWCDMTVVDTFCALLRPTPGLEYTEQALAVQGRTLADLLRGAEEWEAIRDFYAWVRRALPGRPSPWAHNAKFDRAFLLAAHERYNADAQPDMSDYEFCPYSVDFRCTQALFTELRRHGVHLSRSVTLDAVLSHYGIPKPASGRHTAAVDAELTARAVCRLMRDWREITAGAESRTVRAIRAGAQHKGMEG